MKVLVACEFSGTVRDAFIERGHDAYSCDKIKGYGKYPDKHYKQDVEPLLRQEWDLVIAHPPCTYLCNSGVRWFKTYGISRMMSLVEGVRFFKACLEANSPKVCVENPIPHSYAMNRIGIPYTQIIQPWQFGHGHTKATCLWLRGLPPLEPTNIVEGRYPKVHLMSGKRLGLRRSMTYPGIARAMAEQWG